MERCYEQEHRLRTSDFDRWIRLHPAAALDLFQDAAGANADALGVGSDALAARGLLWVVLRVQLVFLAQPRPHDAVLVRTWPNPPGTLDFGRDYALLAADGTPLVQGSSVWAVIRADTRKLAPAKEAAFPPDATREERRVPRLRRLTPLAETEPPRTIPMRFSDLDRNGHVNNARYAALVMDALQPGRDEILRTLRLDYHREILPDTLLRLSVARQGELAQCAGYDEAGTLLFLAEAQFTPQEDAHAEP